MVTQASAELSSPKREQLLATAWRLFYRDGYRAVGIDTLLAEANVAKMTLYKHFSSKEELIVAIIKRRSREVLQGLAEAAAAGRSPDRRLLAIFDWLEVLFASKDFMGCAFIRAISEFPDRNDPIFQAAWGHKQAVRNMLAALAADAHVEDPPAFADEMRLLIDGAIVAAHATASTKPAATARRAAARLLKNSKR